MIDENETDNKVECDRDPKNSHHRPHGIPTRWEKVTSIARTVVKAKCKVIRDEGKQPPTTTQWANVMMMNVVGGGGTKVEDEDEVGLEDELEELEDEDEDDVDDDELVDDGAEEEEDEEEEEVALEEDEDGELDDGPASMEALSEEAIRLCLVKESLRTRREEY
ncbi:hypothetical protein BDN72DRAFT_855341 [Pluteus cervinus]|uniref:Uncharacterized protein n=1 Tax=Pluteus cervinus TaxID=181527 RepID=A0ACD3B4U2_9AGAR|nr:hypothetical protein BDN72DRAFT_855341 [Pluteus cervinus]